MAGINPKLEFYRFTLNPRDQVFKTFREFATETLKAKKNADSDKIMALLFAHFIKSLDGKYSKDDKMKKQIKLEKKAINKYLSNKPKILSTDNIILGVINGGAYGRDRLLADVVDPEVGRAMKKSESVLQYYFFLLYTPLDHNEGCFILQSNSKEETIANIFRNFIGHLFKAPNYNKVNIESFCPKSFQDEFKKGSVIKTIEFKDTQVDTTHTTDGTSNLISEFDLRIEVTPSKKDLSIGNFAELKSVLANFLFGKEKKQKKLNEFDKAKITVQNPVDKSSKTFEWNTKDNDFKPIVYLAERITKKNDDGTPNFDELEQLCINYFKGEVLPELRPDLNVTKAK